MERKTKISAEDGSQEVVITREFDLPVDLLFKAYVEADIVAQWMNTTVLKLDCQPHGSYRFETRDPQGNVAVRMSGVFHEVVAEQKIIRTFEMENTPFPVQLEFLEFEKLTDDSSKLRMKIIYKSIEDRDQMLKLPFAHGLSMAHNRLQEVANRVKDIQHEQA